MRLIFENSKKGFNRQVAFELKLDEELDYGGDPAGGGNCVHKVNNPGKEKMEQEYCYFI